MYVLITGVCLTVNPAWHVKINEPGVIKQDFGTTEAEPPHI